MARYEGEYPPDRFLEDGAVYADGVRWGPIIAGLFLAIATLLILAILGTAIGLTALEPTETDVRTVGTVAAIWGGASALVAFFIGGWVAGRTAAARGESLGLFNGMMVGVTTIVLMLWLVGSGLGTLLGAVTLNLQLLAGIGQSISNGNADAVAADVRAGTWMLLASLLLALAASALGGWAGGRMNSLEVEEVEVAEVEDAGLVGEVERRVRRRRSGPAM